MPACRREIVAYRLFHAHKQGMADEVMANGHLCQIRYPSNQQWQVEVGEVMASVHPEATFFGGFHALDHPLQRLLRVASVASGRIVFDARPL